MRTRDIGKKAAAKLVQKDTLGDLMVLMQKGYVVLSNTPSKDLDCLRLKGGKYAVCYSKEAWQLQRAEQANWKDAVEAHIIGEGEKTNQGDLSKQKADR